MASFFFGRNKPRQDLARAAATLLPRMWEAPPPPRTEEELAKVLAQMKLVLQGTQEAESSPELVAQLVSAIIQEDLLYQLAHAVHLLPFEARKDTQAIFSYVLRFKPPNSTDSIPPAISYIVQSRPEIIIELCKGYESPTGAMPCGVVLREALKHEDIALIILYHDPERAFRIEEIDENVPSTGEGVFWRFFTWIDKGSFEVSTDAFTTFREIITKHKQTVANFVAINFDVFFQKYNNVLILSSSYVTKRQSIKLLGEILLDRANYTVMTAYVDEGDHLKLCMNLLKDDRKMVQYEGFHVFKVFVANPNKSVAVQKILINNREKLLKFLPVFLEERQDDDQFIDEKNFLCRQIEMLPPAPVETLPVNHTQR